ncbi:MAG: glucosyl-3-phosphoglycerate synthase [Veillonellaceae bacterium]|nr:glucosyl-3-phosphoglycerate synthase [Veillonellaceae bacterium]
MIVNGEEPPRDKTVIYSEGWQDGKVAAVLRGGINARAVLDVLMHSGFKEIHIFHMEEKFSYMEDVFLSSVVVPVHELFDTVEINWRRESTLQDLLMKIGSQYEMLFFGAPLATSEILPFYQEVKACYEGSVTIVKAPVVDIEFDESDEIYKWVRQRTYDASDFSLPAVLRNHKKNLGKKIAIILPSLNEERTVANVIKAALEVKLAGIIDEVILIDSQSTDKTVAIAESFGIPIYQHPEVQTQRGTYIGKGEAMYKSAFVTDADIVAWVDTDIESITPGFFYGLLGPMLTNPEIKFCKGYFSRPVRVEASGMELGGGRVTEIFVRPWINSFLPQLSGFIQPLAGTVAIYRDELLKMRIPTNYGVEIAMLIQAVANNGLWSTCQVNLGEVFHRSKDVTGLSAMSFQILQVLIDFMGLKDTGKNDTLRLVYSAFGKSKISSKRFKTFWREYE